MLAQNTTWISLLLFLEKMSYIRHLQNEFFWQYAHFKHMVHITVSLCWRYFSNSFSDNIFYGAIGIRRRIYLLYTCWLSCTCGFCWSHCMHSYCGGFLPCDSLYILVSPTVYTRVVDCCFFIVNAARKTFILDGLMLYHPLYIPYSRYVGLMWR